MSDRFWSKMEFDLDEMRDLFCMLIESKIDAVGKRITPGNKKAGKKAKWRDSSPRWVDDEHGRAVRAWLMIPYIDAINQELLEDYQQTGKRLVKSVERRIAAREFTPELIHEWGLLCRCAGALEIVYHSRPDQGNLRRGSNNLDAHRYWFAHYFLRIYRWGKTKECRDKMEEFINDRFRQLPPGEEKDWFGRFLSDVPSDALEDALQLTGEFRADLKAREMEELIKQPAPPGVMALDLNFPHPKGGLE